MSNRINKYKNYSLSDFTWDDDFRNWVKRPDNISDDFWRQYIVDNAEQEPAIKSAREIILGLKAQEPFISEKEIKESISKVLLVIAENKVSAGFKNNAIDLDRKRIFRMPASLKVAAILLSIISISIVFYYHNITNKKQSIVSVFGNIKEVTLSDSSIVILNANSKITYNMWDKKSIRESWLEGEALFKVKHLDTDNKIADNERFIVHTKDITVEVLGTTFDIRERRNKTEVVLEQGKIKLSFNNKIGQDIIMAPGQIITVDQNTLSNVKDSSIEATDFSAWTDKKLVLNNGSLKEILQYLEDNYGKQIIVEDATLYQRKYQGTIMLDNLDDALFVLSKVLNVNIIKNNKTILLKPK